MCRRRASAESAGQTAFRRRKSPFSAAERGGSSLCFEDRQGRTPLSNRGRGEWNSGGAKASDRSLKSSGRRKDRRYGKGDGNTPDREKQDTPSRAMLTEKAVHLFKALRTCGQRTGKMNGQENVIQRGRTYLLTLTTASPFRSISGSTFQEAGSSGETFSSAGFFMALSCGQ